MELNSVLAVAMMVDQGLGVGLVPDIGPVLSQGRDVRVLALPDQAGGEGPGLPTRARSACCG